MLKLNAEKRDVKTSLELIRKENKIPAVFYGPKVESTPISILRTDFIRVFKEGGETAVIELNVAGETQEVLVHDMATHPVIDDILHIDFYVPEKGKKVEVNVPIEFVGVSKAEKELGGTLVKVMHEVEVRVLPKDIPHSIEADIALITDFETHLTAGMLKLPAGVELITDAEEVVALVNEAREEAEETTPVDISSIEVEKKGKKEEEGEAAA